MGVWGGHEVGFGGCHTLPLGGGGGRGSRGFQPLSVVLGGHGGGCSQSIVWGEKGVEYGEGGAQPLLMAQGWCGGVTIALNGTEGVWGGRNHSRWRGGVQSLLMVKERLWGGGGVENHTGRVWGGWGGSHASLDGTGGVMGGSSHLDGTKGVWGGVIASLNGIKGVWGGVTASLGGTGGGVLATLDSTKGVWGGGEGVQSLRWYQGGMEGGGSQSLWMEPRGYKGGGQSLCMVPGG